MRAWHLAAFLASTLGGCPLADPRAFPPDGEVSADAGDFGDGALDAAGSDVGGIPGLTGERSSDADFAGCLDGTDRDGDRYVDCADVECGRAPVCCVGATRSDCCAEAMVFSAMLSSCAASCGGTASAPFGTPRIDSSGFHPTRSDADDGLVLGGPLDARAGQLTLNAVIEAPASTRGLDYVSFGFARAESGNARVLPVVAVQVNAALRRVSLVIGETTVASTALVGDGPLSYTLVLQPSGAVELRGAVSLAASGVPARSALHPIVYGRSEDALASARVASVALSRQSCDIPAALDAVPVTLLDEAGSFVRGSEENPSIAVGPTGIRFLAFDALRVDEPTRRGVFVAEETAPLVFSVRNPSAATPQPVLSSEEVEEFTDPDLVFETGHWSLLVAGESNGVRSLFRAQTTTDALTFSSPLELMVAGAEGSLDAPAQFGAGRVLARETLESGVTRIVELRLGPDAAVADGVFADGICSVDDNCESASSRDTRYLLTTRSGTHFDSDEVDAPSIVVSGGIHRLYYAGRHGTRWAVGMVVSEDGAYWRRISDTAGAPDVVLGGDDLLAPLGSRAASVLLEGTTLTLVFEGYRGVRSQFLIAQQTLR